VISSILLTSCAGPPTHAQAANVTEKVVEVEFAGVNVTAKLGSMTECARLFERFECSKLSA
jgi:hypothetical protein